MKTDPRLNPLRGGNEKLCVDTSTSPSGGGGGGGVITIFSLWYILKNPGVCAIIVPVSSAVVELCVDTTSTSPSPSLPRPSSFISTLLRGVHGGVCGGGRVVVVV